MIPNIEYSWREFKDYCYEFQFNGDAYFRGQSDEKWGLRPSFSRIAEDMDLDAYFTTVLPNTARHLSGYADYSFNLDEERDKTLLLGLLQHHGFPTPLLDWTRLTIRFLFAFSDHAYTRSECDHIAIWMLNGEFVYDFLHERERMCIQVCPARFSL